MVVVVVVLAADRYSSLEAVAEVDSSHPLKLPRNSRRILRQAHCLRRIEYIDYQPLYPLLNKEAYSIMLIFTTG